MSDVVWVKLAVNMFNSSRKIKKIELMQGGDTILIIWIKLLCLAGDINDGGAIYITPTVPYDIDSLADELRKPPKIVKKALDIFESFEMIDLTEEGFIYLSSWSKYQNIEGLDKIREQNRIRKQRQRDRSRDCHVTVTDDVTGCHALEEEEDIEAEISFNQSIAREENELFEAEKKASQRVLWDNKLGKGVVFFSDDQAADLLQQLSLDEFNYYVGVVADCELSGKRFKNKTHYQAILDMARKDRKVK